MKDNVDDNENDGSRLEASWKDNNLASSLPESDEEQSKMEVKMKVEVPKGNESSQVFPPETSKGSSVKERGEVHEKDRRETSDSSEESKCDSSRLSNCDNLKVLQSKCHAKGGKHKAKLGVTKGRGYSRCILSSSS
eukprot:3747956-Ditylum_brightwellii.AAC.1